MASVKKCKHCGKVMSDEDEAFGYDGICSKCVFDIIWNFSKHHPTMNEKRKCKVCKDEKNASIYEETIASSKGWSAGNIGCILSFPDDGPRFIPSPRMTIATAAMQGLLSEGWGSNSAEFAAQKAVDFADALLNKLSEPKDGVQGKD